MEKNDQKEGLFKRLENIKDKNEKLLNAFSAAIKVIKSAKNQSEYNCENAFAFYSFYRGFKKFERMSLGSKYGEINDFYMLLNAFINDTKQSLNSSSSTKRLYISTDDISKVIVLKWWSMALKKKKL